MATADPAREPRHLPALAAALPVVAFGVLVSGLAFLLGTAGYGVLPGILIAAGGVVYGRAVAERAG